jgi:hypothetical protein
MSVVLVAAFLTLAFLHAQQTMAYYERRQTPGLQINNPGGMILLTLYE